MVVGVGFEPTTGFRARAHQARPFDLSGTLPNGVNDGIRTRANGFTNHDATLTTRSPF